MHASAATANASSGAKSSDFVTSNVPTGAVNQMLSARYDATTATVAATGPSHDATAMTAR